MRFGFINKSISPVGACLFMHHFHYWMRTAVPYIMRRIFLPLNKSECSFRLGSENDVFFCAAQFWKVSLSTRSRRPYRCVYLLGGHTGIRHQTNCQSQRNRSELWIYAPSLELSDRATRSLFAMSVRVANWHLGCFELLMFIGWDNIYCFRYLKLPL